MYARSIVEQRIEIAQEELDFELEYHSTSEVDDFIKRLEERHQDAYAAARSAARGGGDSSNAYQKSLIQALANPENPKLSSDEIRFIENERALSICDAEYWLTRHYWIKTQTATIRFEFRAGQRVYFNVIQRLHAMGAPIELIMAKARQLGISTVTEGLIVHGVNFGHSVNAVVASADEGKTAEMSKMTFLGYDSMEWWLKVLYTRRVESNRGMLQLGGTKSGISFQHGQQMSGIGRGSTFLRYHLSEVASYSNPAYLIEAALFKCVHPHPDVFGVLESTAEGNTGWFYNTFWSAVRKKQSGDYSRLTALFLPFTVAPDQYPNATWIRLNPIPADWKPIDETLLMMQRAEDYIHNTPDLAAVLGSNWQISREQAWWWECEFLDHRAKGSEKLWCQEMPCTAEEAFQSSYENVFGREVIAEIDGQRETQYGAYAIIGQSIEDRYEPDEDEIDKSEERIPIKFTNRAREVTYKWEMVPVYWQEEFDLARDIGSDYAGHMGKTFIYRKPEPGYDYSMGVVTGNGIGTGETVVAVSRRGRDPQEPDIQVAEFRSDEVSHIEAYAWAAALSAYYSQFMGDNPEYRHYGIRKREPYVAIEQVQTAGDTCLVQMQKMGFRRFHRMVRYDTDPRNNQKYKSRKLGWYTFTWSAPMFLDSYVIWVRNGWYKVNSFSTIAEMDKWEQRPSGDGNKAKYIAQEDWNDAGLRANAMAAFCVNDMKPMAERTMKRCYSVADSKPVFDFKPTVAGWSFPMPAISGREPKRPSLFRR